MILDTSALLAILLGEPDARLYTEAIEAAAVKQMSAATLAEASIVIAKRKGAGGLAALEKLLLDAGVRIIPVDEAQAHETRNAWLRFGKGNHPAGLNFGDCFAYALASSRTEPLLFKGNDFSQTDIVPSV